jgi:hypothetical protein
MRWLGVGFLVYRWSVGRLEEGGLFRCDGVALSLRLGGGMNQGRALEFKGKLSFRASLREVAVHGVW